MSAPVSSSSTSLAARWQEQLKKLWTQRAVAQPAPTQLSPRDSSDGFEAASSGPRRRASDGDGFVSAARRSPARPDGQGPLPSTPVGVEGGQRATDPVPTSVPQTDDTLGQLSKKYESGNRGPGTVSGGKGDAGGVSYGTFQMSSKHNGKAGGTVNEFVKSLKTSHPDYYAALAGKKPGSKAFTKAWKELAAKDPKGFEAAQHEFIKKTHYDPAKKAVEKATGIDFDKRSKALRDVLWSTADQHRGGTAEIFKKALHGRDPSKMTDAEIIKAVYAERGRTNSHGKLVHFSHNSTKVQKSVAERFKHEAADALEALRREQQTAAAA